MTTTTYGFSVSLTDATTREEADASVYCDPARGTLATARRIARERHAHVYLFDRQDFRRGHVYPSGNYQLE